MSLFFLASCIFIGPEQREAHLCEAGLAGPALGDADGDEIADCLDEEECDGVDNDGDGRVDEDLYPDEDGDGFGDENATGACHVGWIRTPGDCDDSDGTVNPAAPFELCDGKNTLCGADWTEDRDVVTLYPRDPDTSALGEPSDLTDAFLATEPEVVTLHDGELLNVCPARDGAYTVTVLIAADATSFGIHGVLPEDGCETTAIAGLPTLSGGGVDTPIRLEGAIGHAAAAIDCLGITGGGADGTIGGGLIVGADVTASVTRSAIWGNSGVLFGGVWNQGELLLEEVDIVDNTVSDAADADGAGGIRNEGSLEMISGRLTGNGSANRGGGANILSGDAQFYGTTFGGNGDDLANVALNEGGALAVSETASVELHGVRIAGNRVVHTMGGAIYTAGTLTCTEGTRGEGEIAGNSTGEPGTGGIYFAGGDLRVERYDFSHNSGADVYDEPASAAMEPLGVDACFECVATGCVEIGC
jgi:hypothetical protein